MATLNEEELAIASSLEVEDIPVKLRCGTCNKVAVGAVKLPCCETAICGNCCATIPETCPICGHSPVSSDSCTIYKSLRNTIKAHVKIELKKRSAQQAPIIDAAPTEVPTAPVAGDEALAQQLEGMDTTATAVPAGEDPISVNDGPSEEAAASRSADELPEEDIIAQDGEVADDDTADKSDVEFITERPDDQEPKQGHVTDEQSDQVMNQELGQDTMNHMQMQNPQQGFGYDMSQQTQGDMGFGNMSNFNPMMGAAMGGMGMPGFPMGMSNMMGMPMDPSMMFNQFGGMNGMGDMSMMNMGMMGGFGGGMGGMNQGYGGYNQFGNAMNQQHHNFPHNNRGFSRPYGRGFGRGARGYAFGRGRGGWGQNQNGYRNQSQQVQYGSQFPGGQQQAQEEEQQYEGNVSTEPNARHGSHNHEAGQSTGEEVQKPDAHSHPSDVEGQESSTNTGNDRFGAENSDADPLAGNQQYQSTVGLNASRDGADHLPDAGQGLGPGPEDLQDSAYIYGQTQDFNHSVGTRDTANFNTSRSGPYIANPAPAEYKRPSPPPANAPTGPKAMREGKPNSGIYSRPQVSLANDRVNDGQQKASERAGGRDSGLYGENVEQDGTGYDRHQRNASRDDSKDGNQRQEKSHGRFQDDEYESDATYNRRKEKERRRRKEREREKRHAEDVDDGNDGNDGKRARSRSASPDDDSSRRHQRRKDDKDRSRYERSRERRKGSHRDYSVDADTSRDDGSGKRKSKTHRSDRRGEDQMDRGSHRSSKRDYYKDDDAETSRGHKDRSSRHHGHRDRGDRERDSDRDSHTRRGIEQPEDEIGFKIKGSNKAAREKKLSMSAQSDPPSSRRASNAQGSAPTSLDPYAAERERFKQERAAKDALRRQGGGSGKGSLGKHGRARDEEEGGSRKRRDGNGR